MSERIDQFCEGSSFCPLTFHVSGGSIDPLLDNAYSTGQTYQARLGDIAISPRAHSV
jgi:hypothetical protein